MPELNSKAVADKLSEIAEGLEALSGLFRAAVGAEGAGKADGKAKKPVSGKSKPDPEPADVDIDTVREKLKELVAKKGKDVMVQALESVGAGKLADVDESQYAELLAKADELLEAEPEEEPVKAKKAPAKKGKKAGPTLDEVNDAAKALIEADKPAYVKLMKKLGKPSDMDEGDYAAAIAAYEAAMPAEEEEEEEEELL